MMKPAYSYTLGNIYTYSVLLISDGGLRFCFIYIQCHSVVYAH